MAVVAAPFAAVGVGAAYFAALSKTYTAAANFSAQKAFGLEDAYPWPFWRSWFNSQVQSNSTSGGTLAAVGLAALAFGVQRRLLWRPLSQSLRVSQPEQQKIRSTGQFVKIIGPGIVELSATAMGTCLIVGAARPFIDGNNLHKA